MADLFFSRKKIRGGGGNRQNRSAAILPKLCSRPSSRHYSRPISRKCSRPMPRPVLDPFPDLVLSHQELVYSHSTPSTKWLPNFPSHSHLGVAKGEPFEQTGTLSQPDPGEDPFLFRPAAGDTVLTRTARSPAFMLVDFHPFVLASRSRAFRSSLIYPTKKKSPRARVCTREDSNPHY